jgi:O-antigen ligase
MNLTSNNIFFYSKKISIFLIAFYPIALVVGPLIAEALILIINLLFIFNYRHKIFSKDKNIIFFLIIWSYLILNIFISLNENFEFMRQLFYIRFIIFAYAIKNFLSSEADFSLIFKTWILFFIIIFVDLTYEKINGSNLLGFQSPNDLRLVGFLKDELRIAYIISGFCFLITGYLMNLKKNQVLAIAFMIITISIIFITGERSNFIKSIIFLILFSTFLFKDNIKTILITNLIILLTIITLIVSVKSSRDLYTHFYERLFLKDKDNKINLYLNYKGFQHSSHYDSAIKIANDYPFFGVGIKNYRLKCLDKKYENPDLVNNKERCSIHPHQIYFEIVSETGYIGILLIIFPLFLFIIKNMQIFFIHKNYIHLSGLIVLIIHLIPILPSGSFFTNFTGLVFWLNVGFVLATSKFKKI